MARASILTIEPIGLGGVARLTSAMYALQKEAGHDPHLVYLDQESVPSDGKQALIKYYQRHWRPQWEVRREGMQGLSIPLYPLPTWAGWYVPALVAPRALRTDIRIVVSGGAQVGLPYALSRRPFVIWMATRYIDELQGRAQAGDSWARDVIASSTWQRLLAQEARVLRKAARIIAISPYTARRIIDDYPELADRIDTVLCPIDTIQFSPANGKATNPIGSPFLLLTARIRDPRKNVRMLLKAFACVHTSRPELKLVITGDPPLATDAALCEQLGLKDSVVFLPSRSRADLVRYYQSAELFVLPSTQEGLAISVLEALACGLPVVATRCGGPESVIEDGRTGKLVANNDAEAFATAVLDLLSDTAQLAAARKSAATYARATFDWQTISAQLKKSLNVVYPQHFEA